jgi:hypothetical protein
LLDLVGDMKAAKKELRSIRKERGRIDQAVRLGDMDEADARIERDMLKEEENAAIMEFNSIYIQGVSKPKGP